MKPVIGLTTSINEDESVLMMNRSYISAVTAAGALPVLLPATDDPDVIAGYVQMIDGLLLTGGGDIDPASFHENQEWACGEISPVRDAFELQLCKAYLARGKGPVLGICRGVQLLNVALGGSLYQDLAAAYPNATLAHRQKQRGIYPSHNNSISPGSRLSRILSAHEIRVNSHHHQALKRVADTLSVSATAPDGVIEAVEMRDHPFCIGVQWHPERLWNQPGGEMHARIFQAFVENAIKL